LRERHESGIWKATASRVLSRDIEAFGLWVSPEKKSGRDTGYAVFRFLLQSPKLPRMTNMQQRDSDNNARNNGARLTARQREVVKLVAEGKMSKEIAERLNISVHTVETHRSNIMHKLKIHSVGEIVRYAIRNKITKL
jgi:DNA-binding CsgD family transcriptional regulator